MIHRRKHLRQARHILISMMRAQNLPFSKAAPLVISNPANFNLMLDAVGGHYQGHLPPLKVMRRWLTEPFPNPLKEQARALFPTLSKTEIATQLGVNLPTIYKWITSKRPPLKEQALSLHPEFTRSQIARQLGVHLSSIYRWIPKT